MITQTARIPTTELATYHRNPRRGNVKAIADSLRTLGQYRPIVVNAGTHTGRPNEVVAGNHTLLAARELGWDHVDAVIIDVDDITAARIVAADNRTADLGHYDNAELLDLLSGLPDLDGTGYDDHDLQELLQAVTKAAGGPVALTDPDAAPDVPESDPVTRPGDVWQLGPHRVMCGSATVLADVQHVLDGEQATCVWTDPPYGVDYVGKTKDALTIANDGSAGLEQLLNDAFRVLVEVARPGAPVYVAHADFERVTFETCLRGAGVLVRQNLIWAKNVMVMGRADYHWKHEPILYGFTPGGEGRLGRGGPNWYGDNAQTTVLAYDKPAANRQHPTMKPVALVQHMLTNSCPAGGTVLDLFGGSGSTLIAAHHMGAQARLVELDPCYVDVICRRWQEHTGQLPERDGKPHDFTTDSEHQEAS
jgi:DNA modification methylase